MTEIVVKIGTWFLDAYAPITSKPEITGATVYQHLNYIKKCIPQRDAFILYSITISAL